MLSALAQTAARALWSKARGAAQRTAAGANRAGPNRAGPNRAGPNRTEPTAAAAYPSPELRETLPARPQALVRDYVRRVGGDPAGYKGTVPAHLFPQWGFPLAARTLHGLPYPMLRVVNAGCRLEMRAPLPAGEPLQVRARIESLDDDGRRAVIEQRIVTGTAQEPEAVVAHLFAFVPLTDPKKGEAGVKKPRSRVPIDARELAFWSLRADAGLEFAMLTGDLNPVHWVPAYARAFGFKSAILHGFSTLARAVEGLNRALFCGDTTRLASLDVRFTRPLVLPARVGLYVRDHALWVGDAPGGGAYLEGTFTTLDRAGANHG